MFTWWKYFEILSKLNTVIVICPNNPFLSERSAVPGTYNAANRRGFE